MTDTTTAPPADPGPPPTAPPGLPSGSDRFFSWVSGLGIVRADAWLGGVCGGLAARLRIDPIIVRGIFVVVALLGFPALLVYAIAWALLPDTTGRIHLRELFHGRYDAAMTGVFILAVVGFVPVVPWLRNVLLWPVWALTGFAPWAWDSGDGITALDVLGFLLGLALIGGLVYLIVRSARAERNSRAGAPTASAHTAATVAPASGGVATPLLAADAASTADSAGRAPAESAQEEMTDASAAAFAMPEAAAGEAAAGVVGDGLAGGAAAEGGAQVVEDPQVADWRAQQEAWRTQHQAWQRSQQDASRAAREQARRERQAAGAVFAAEAEERRRIRRATSPRTSFVFVLTALGAALVVGALTVLTALATPYAGAIGILAAAIVTALAMVVAGVARRRSGFLTAVTIVLLVIGGVVAAASGPARFVVGNAYLGTSTAEQNLTQFGQTWMTVSPLSETKDVEAGDIVLTKGFGDTTIELFPGTHLEIETTLAQGTITYTHVPIDPDDADWSSEAGELQLDADRPTAWTVDNPDPDTTAVTTQHLSLDERVGSVHIMIYDK